MTSELERFIDCLLEALEERKDEADSKLMTYVVERARVRMRIRELLDQD
jgi:hypothetical protein